MDESEAAASSADFLLAAEEVMAAIRHLHARGGLDSISGCPPDEANDDRFRRRASSSAPGSSMYNASMQTIPAAVHPRIVCDPNIVGGSPTIRGTRVPVRAIACLWRATESLDDLKRNYPHLSDKDIEAAINYYELHRSEIDTELFAEEQASD